MYKTLYEIYILDNDSLSNDVKTLLKGILVIIYTTTLLNILEIYYNTCVILEVFFQNGRQYVPIAFKQLVKLQQRKQKFMILIGALVSIIYIIMMMRQTRKGIISVD